MNSLIQNRFFSFTIILLAITGAMILEFIMPARVQAGTSIEKRNVFSQMRNKWNNNRDSEWDNWDEDNWGDEFNSSEDVSPVFRYNRVEGIFIGMHRLKDVWRKNNDAYPVTYGNWGYAFAAKEFQYQFGLEKGFGNNFRFAVGGEYHRVIDTPDKWFLTEMENSLAALLFREDFHDFYLRDGFSVYAVQNFGRHLHLTGGYKSEDYKSVKNHANWALFGGKRKFSENPNIGEGDVKSIYGQLSFDTRNNKRKISRGWFVQLESEYAGSGFNDDEVHVYEYFLLDIRRYQPIGYSNNFDIRIRAGSSTGKAPWYHTFYLGGVGSLRGYGHKEFPKTPTEFGGNRMILGQIEYRLDENEMADLLFGGVPFFHLVLFGDAGWINLYDINAEIFDGFDGLTFSDFKSDIGIALSNNEGSFRIELAKRVDTGDKPFSFWLRLARTF